MPILRSYCGGLYCWKFRAKYFFIRNLGACVIIPLQCTVKQFQPGSSTFVRFCVLGQNKGINGENLRQIEILLFKHHKRSISGSSGSPHSWTGRFSDRDCYCFCMNKQSTVETNFYLEQSLHDFQYRNVSTIFMKALFYRGPILE
jgi:hypothetical protein